MKKVSEFKSDVAKKVIDLGLELALLRPHVVISDEEFAEYEYALGYLSFVCETSSRIQKEIQLKDDNFKKC